VFGPDNEQPANGSSGAMASAADASGSGLPARSRPVIGAAAISRVSRRALLLARATKTDARCNITDKAVTFL